MDTGAEYYRRFLNGDETGFNEILRLYHDNLIYFINRYVHNFPTAEDLAADTFMELLVHKKRYAFKSSFKTYLFSIAHHKTIDYLRRESRHPSVALDTVSDTSSDAEAVERAVLSEEKLIIIRRLTDTLCHDYATYLHLSLFEGMENEEVALIMQKNKKQIANLAYRAKEALKEAMRKEGIAP